MMVEACRTSSSLEVRGADVSAPWARGHGSSETLLDTTHIGAPLQHEPGDLTVAAGGGVPVARLQEQLGRAGQFLPLAPPSSAAGATIGGVVSAGDAGPLRHHYGSWRDAVIGMTAVLADGTVARSGGRVIKNVAGFDVAKLLCGALGSLGLIAEVVLRVHPLPESRRTTRVEASPARATAFVLELLASPLVPAAVDMVGGTVWVGFEGRRSGAAAQAEAAAEMARRQGLPADCVDGDEERALWDQVARATCGLPGAAGSDGGSEVTVLRAVTLPSRLGAVAELVERSAGEAGVGAEMAAHAGLGIHTIRLAGGGADDHACVLRAVREGVTGLGGMVTVRDHLPDMDDAHLLAGPAPPGAAIMRRVKEAFDPGGRLSPGRFAPWW